MNEVNAEINPQQHTEHAVLPARPGVSHCSAPRGKARNAGTRRVDEGRAGCARAHDERHRVVRRLRSGPKGSRRKCAAGRLVTSAASAAYPPGPAPKI